MRLCWISVQKYSIRVVFIVYIIIIIIIGKYTF